MSQHRFGRVVPAALLGLSSLAIFARAEAPRIDSISPIGVQRGSLAEINISGANLGGSVELIAPFGIKFATPAAPNKEAGKWSFKATVDPATPIGVYLIRLKTEEGLSNPFLLAVGQLPQVVEKEDNSSFESAQTIPLNSVVEGQAAGNDVDYFRFAGKKGQRVVVDAQCARIGSGVDPSIRLTTLSRKYVSSADDTAGLLTDARLTATLPEDGEYVVELSDSRYQGGGRPIYRLIVGTVPVADEVFPLGGRRGETVGFELRGGTIGNERLAVAKVVSPPGLDLFHPKFSAGMLGLDSAGPSMLDVESLSPLAVDDYPEVREPVDPAAPTLRLAVPILINGRIESKGDEDKFTLIVTPGQKLHIDVTAADLGSSLDGVLQVRNASGAVLATADDTTAPTQGRNMNRRLLTILSPDPALDFTVPSGLTEITLVLKDLKGEGGVGFPYRIAVEPSSASFDLTLGDAQISVPKGGTVAVSVTAIRRGYNGPIDLSIKALPKGLTVRPGTILEGQAVGILTLSCAGDASISLTSLNVVGQSRGATPPMVESATKALVFAQQATLPTNIVNQRGLPAVSTNPSALNIDSPATPIELVQGFGGSVPLKLVRAGNGEGALTITPLFLPVGQAPPPNTAPTPISNGLAVPNLAIPPKAADAALVVNAAVETPLGLGTFAVVAKGKVAGRDQSFAVPLIQVNVVRPASIETSAPGIEIKAGATVEYKGKLIRKGPFKEPVTIKLDGLPAGLKADAVIVAPDKSDFTLKIVADPKAAPSAGSARLVPAFQINKKDYATPPTPLTFKVLAAK